MISVQKQITLVGLALCLLGASGGLAQDPNGGGSMSLDANEKQWLKKPSAESYDFAQKCKDATDKFVKDPWRLDVALVRTIRPCRSVAKMPGMTGARCAEYRLSQRADQETGQVTGALDPNLAVFHADVSHGQGPGVFAAVVRCSFENPDQGQAYWSPELVSQMNASEPIRVQSAQPYGTQMLDVEEKNMVEIIAHIAEHCPTLPACVAAPELGTTANIKQDNSLFESKMAVHEPAKPKHTSHDLLRIIGAQ